jgi:signal transduction histidine kinase
LIALERAATDLGDGNFAVTTEQSGVPEIDRASESLGRTATRLADVMARERNFSTHASHQLRTPLTTLRLQLETGLQAGPEALARAAVDAIGSADRLEQTIDDVLALARGTDSRGMRLNVDDIFDDVRQRWHGPLAAADRPLRFVVDDAVTSRASRVAARQILDVLVDNALQHGSGAVTLRARESSGALAIDVSDEGAPPGDLTDIVSGKASRDRSRGDGSRLGLPLARSMAEAEGGRLVVAGDGSHTQLTLLLPSPSE